MTPPVLGTTTARQAEARPALPPAAGSRLRRAEAALARPWLLVALLVVYVPFFAAFFGSRLPFSLPRAADACQGQPVLDQRWGYTPQEVGAYLQSCGAAGRAAISAQQAADLAYPALFAAVLTVASALLLRALRLPERHRAHALVLLPAITAAADYLENAGIRVLLATFPRQPGIVPAMSVVTTVKLATGWACTAVLLVLGAAAAFRWLRVHVTRRPPRAPLLPGSLVQGRADATGRRPPAPPRQR